jgi:hypothetical protein
MAPRKCGCSRTAFAAHSTASAIERDPDYTTPHGMAAWCYLWRNANGWTTSTFRPL